ncbi:MAG: (2Fe-2S)-binding protein [Chitinophagaceae bacterium]|nr:MAG: (2Fe-2S)-binding protein [Chitinophagaceae bacterium]
MGDKFRWTKVAESLAEVSFGTNNLAEVMADDKKICIGRYKEELFAFAPKCPHASGFFVDGFIDALGNVVCPLHRYKFCMKNGRNVSGEGYYLKHWPVEIRQDGVYVGLEGKSFLGLF